MRKHFPAVVAMLISFFPFLVATIRAQEPKASIHLDVRSVTVDAAVLDSAGKAITSLSWDDFRVYEDGETRQIQGFDATEVPFRTLLVFDCRSLDASEALLYGSIGPNQYSTVISKPKRSTLKIGDPFLLPEKSSMMIVAAARFVEGLEPKTLLAVAVTDDRGIRLIHDWDGKSAEIELRSACDDHSVGLLLESTFEARTEPDKEKVKFDMRRDTNGRDSISDRELRALIPAGEKIINEPFAVRTVDPVEAKLRSTGGRKAVVWFGPVFDFDAFNSSPSLEGYKERDWKADPDFQDALRLVTSRAAAYYPVSVHRQITIAPAIHELHENNEEQRIKRLEELAKASGGRVLYAEKPHVVDSLAEQLNREIGATYSLSFVSPNSAPDNRYHKIEVKVRDPKLRVQQSRAGYFSSQN